MYRIIAGLAMALVLVPGLAAAQDSGPVLDPTGNNPGWVEPPEWFKLSFLDLQEDVEEAAAEDRRVLLYFLQDGCPYCERLVRDNWGQRDIADLTRTHFDVIAINMWGDQPVTDLDGNQTTERQIAEDLRVQYTPTLVFLDEQGDQVIRINGYYPPHQFRALLEWAGKGLEDEMSASEYYARLDPPEASGELHDQPFFLDPPDHNLQAIARESDRHLLVLFEQPHCPACDELHQEIFPQKATLEQVENLDVVRLDRYSEGDLIGPDGQATTPRDWARDLDVKYSPAFVYFDSDGEEVFRADAYFRAFHVQSVMEYVHSGAYREQPNLQRFIQARADRLYEEGVEVELW